MEQIYLFKAYRFTNVHGQKMYEYCYFETLDEALKARELEIKNGNECTGIWATGR